MKKLNFESTTLLITLKDNEIYSNKLVNYLNFQNFNIQIFIADGSAKSQEEIFKKLRHKYTYYYFGEDINFEKYFLKIKLSLEKIQTEYIFFCDQDDYINFKCLKKKEDILISNKKISATIGNIFNFTENGDENYIVGKMYNFKIRNYDNAIIRLLRNKLFKGYYCLHRKNNLIKSFDLIIKHKAKDLRTAEFVLNTHLLMQGNIFFIKDEISLLRWAGNKYKVHPIKYSGRSHIYWFLKNISSNNKLLDELIIHKMRLFSKSFSTKILLFIFHIIPIELRKFYFIIRKFLLRLFKIFVKVSYKKNLSFPSGKPEQIFINFSKKADTQVND